MASLCHVLHNCTDSNSKRNLHPEHKKFHSFSGLMQHGQKLMLRMHIEGTEDGSAQSTFHIHDQVGPIMLSGIIADKLALISHISYFLVQNQRPLYSHFKVILASRYRVQHVSPSRDCNRPAADQFAVLLARGPRPCKVAVKRAPEHRST